MLAFFRVAGNIPELSDWVKSNEMGLAISGQFRITKEIGISLTFDFLFFRLFIIFVISSGETGGIDIEFG